MDDIEKRARYISALEKINSTEISDLQSAITEFSSIPGYKDAGEKIVYCKEKIKLLENNINRKKSNKRIVILVLLACIVVGAVAFIIKGMNDSKQLNNSRNEHYTNAMSYLDNNQYQEAALEFGKAGDYEDAASRSLETWDKVMERDIISIGANFVVAVRDDGTVATAGGQQGVSEWTDIIDVAAGYTHVVGLKTDGTVVASGNSSSGEGDVSKWNNVVDVLAETSYTVGLKSDGTVLFAGFDGNGLNAVREWTDIIKLWLCAGEIVGLKLDGTLVSTAEEKSWYPYWYEDEFYNQLIKWETIDGEQQVLVEETTFGSIYNQDNIIKYESGDGDTQILALKNDGTVIAAGWNGSGQCDVLEWTDIIDISAGVRNAVGLKKDGTVVVAGSNEYEQNSVEGWQGIIGIASDNFTTVGIREDGTLVCTSEVFADDIATINNVKHPQRPWVQ